MSNSRISSSGNAQSNITEDERKFFSDDNNFIEYFIEIGVKPDIFSNINISPKTNLSEINSKLQPEIISKFPHFDKKSMAIDATIIDYIFPKTYSAILSTQTPQPQFYSLILDNQFYSSLYSYKYIACFVIYEKLIIYKKLYDTYSNNNENNEEFMNNIKNIYVPKCLCLASVHPSINKFESILRAIYEYFRKGRNYFFDLIIEKLVCQTPKIPRGLKKVSLKIHENFIDLTEKKMNELSSIDVNLKELFYIFKIDKIVDIFKCLLFEIKIIFFSSNISEITKIIMCFLTLLKPFEYQYRILSILPKDHYFFLEDNNPSIFGINELYSNSFFEDNKLILGNKPVCIIDIDKKDYHMINNGNLQAKSLPSIPKHLKEKLDKRTEEYKKNKKKEETNEGYQDIFYRFMINLLKDYPKFLKKNFNGNSNKVDDMIDKIAYINAQSSADKEFYEKIIYSQMFDDLITKRMIPRDTREKIEALFFEEKLNVKHAQKKLIRGNKILDQNVLLPSKDYDFQEPNEVIYLTESNTLLSKLNINSINFFYRENINNDVCVPRGYVVRSGNSKNELLFDYYLFPTLLSEYLFKFNCKDYITPPHLTSNIENINEDILHNCFIKFDDRKKNKSGELINDVYISYLIIFALSFWYTDKEERETRFNYMLEILSKIENHDMEVTEMLFNSLIKLGEEQLAYFLYSKYNEQHINLTWKIFSLMSKILHKNQNIYTESIKECKSSRGSMKMGNARSSLTFSIKNIDQKNFRTRTIKSEGLDDDILGEEILFDAFGVCLDCKSDINLEKICNELSIKELDKNNRFKCKCNSSSIQKLNFRIGTELFNQMISKNTSSYKSGIVLYCPHTLKKKLLYISNLFYNTEFDVETFRIKYPEEFWNSIWYFELKGIDISFMLPYLKPNKIKNLSKKTEISNFIEFKTKLESNNNKSKNKEQCEIIKTYEFINPNNQIETVEKNEILLKKFNNNYLFVQNVLQFSIIKIIGMIMYKTKNCDIDNISSNEKILKITETKKNNKNENYVEKKEIKEKQKSNIIHSNNLTISDLDLATSSNTIEIDNIEEYNKLMDGNVDIEDYNENIKKSKNNKKKNKVHFTTEDMFEYIKEDDTNYNIFKEYREDDNSDDDNI